MNPSTSLKEDCAWVNDENEAMPTFIEGPAPKGKVTHCPGRGGPRDGTKRPTGETYDGCTFTFEDSPMFGPIASSMTLSLRFVGVIRDACKRQALRAVDAFHVDLVVSDGKLALSAAHRTGTLHPALGGKKKPMDLGDSGASGD